MYEVEGQWKEDTVQHCDLGVVGREGGRMLEIPFAASCFMKD